MAINVSLPTDHIDYSGYDTLPDRVKITDFQLSAKYYKRFYLSMSHGGAYQGLYAAFRRAIQNGEI